MQKIIYSFCLMSVTEIFLTFLWEFQVPLFLPLPAAQQGLHSILCCFSLFLIRCTSGNWVKNLPIENNIQTPLCARKKLTSLRKKLWEINLLHFIDTESLSFSKHLTMLYGILNEILISSFIEIFKFQIRSFVYLFFTNLVDAVIC